MTVRLSEWAEQQGVHYQTAWKWFRDGKLPVPATQTATGTILVNVAANPTPGGGGLYARVSSHDQRGDLDRQVARLSQWAAQNGHRVVRVEAEVGSAMNGARPKVRRLWPTRPLPPSSWNIAIGSVE